jgi:hypothetical protein
LLLPGPQKADFAGPVLTLPVPPLELDGLFEGNRARSDALDAVMAHPRFADAMRIVIAGWLSMAGGNRLMNTIVTDRGRMLVSLFAVYLHDQRRPGDSSTGLTPGRMKAILEPHDVCSPGRIDALLAVMRMLGYLTVLPDREDRRLRRLQPTEKLLELQRRRSIFTFEAMAVVLPEGGEALAALDRPGFLQAYLGRVSEIYLGGNFYVKIVPEMSALHERNGGLTSMYCLLLAGEPDDAFPPLRPVHASVSRLARRLGISRAQMRRLFAMAETEGLIAREGEGESWRLLPKLDGAARLLVAHFIVNNTHAARLALEGLAHQDMAA